MAVPVKGTEGLQYESEDEGVSQIKYGVQEEQSPRETRANEEALINHTQKSETARMVAVNDTEGLQNESEGKIGQYGSQVEQSQRETSVNEEALTIHTRESERAKLQAATRRWQSEKQTQTKQPKCSPEVISKLKSFLHKRKSNGSTERTYLKKMKTVSSVPAGASQRTESHTESNEELKSGPVQNYCTPTDVSDLWKMVCSGSQYGDTKSVLKFGAKTEPVPHEVPQQVVHSGHIGSEIIPENPSANITECNKQGPEVFPVNQAVSSVPSGNLPKFDVLGLEPDQEHEELMKRLQLKIKNRNSSAKGNSDHKKDDEG